ncbi:hybrid sensor histidine kinase/response regulator [Marivirga lumbricoides]|uniref:histidine kinase n=2 Tax=Marivirga lumbricoides TaxID=1046115 RepID=A0ABQ1M7V7_9BACT|nr:hybrid sensor histidine kinase/response regulator [Marivirga lumbricoides]
MWFGTKDGLNRFDGYSFKIFRGTPNDSTGLVSNIIQTLYEKDGKLWVGTDKGLYEYNAQLETLRLVKFTANRIIRAIYQDDRNNLWFIADLTLFKYNTNTKDLHEYKIDKYFGATSITSTPRGDLYVSTDSGEINQYDPTLDTFRSFNIFRKSEKTSYRWIEKIYAVDDETLLIGTQSQGVKIFDINTGSYKDVLPFDIDHGELFVRDFVKENEETYWVATESGVFIYDVKEQTFTNLKKSYNNPYAISDNAVYSVYRDKEGGIWAGTYFGGVNYYPKQYTSFKKYFPKTGENSLSGNAVREICQDQYGNLWIGTEDAGINKFNPDTGLFKSYGPARDKSNLSHYNIHGLLAIENELWIGTFHHGIDVMDLTSGKIIRHYSADGKSGSFRSNFIYCIYQTRSGTILIATSQGLYRFNSTSDDFTALPEEADIYPYTTVVMQATNGTIWAGTFKEGVYYFNEKTKEKGFFKYDSQNKSSLSNNAISSIFEDSKKQIWIATENGLNKFNPSGNNFIRYSTKNGLPSNVIYDLLEDDQNNLWISTSKGLACFNPETEQVKVFTKAHGLLSDQFNYNSSFKTDEGIMYFGSVKGMISFNPAEFVNDTYVPPIYITGFQMQNEELPIQEENSPLVNAINYTDKIVLPHNASSFSIDFAALSYTAPEMTEYAYKMAGLDNQWTYLKTNRKIYFTELAPGSYTFKVKASNSSGLWNDEAATLNIVISPPWWAGNLAYVLYTLLGGLIIFLSVRNYHKKIEKKNRRKLSLLENEKEKEIYQAKIEFFTNIAHEIRTPLTLIKGPLESVIKASSNNHTIGNNLLIMEKNTNRLLELTNQLLDFRKTEIKGFSLTFVKADVMEILKETFERFKLAAEQKGLLWSIDISQNHLYAYVDPEALTKIFSNLFSNAVKYGEQSSSVHLLPFNANEDSNFTIIFKNDGSVIPMSLRAKVFEPFFRLEENENQSGTGIGLPLARSLAELHKGTLELDLTNITQNVFILTLPVHQEKEFNLYDEDKLEVDDKEVTDHLQEEASTKPVILIVDDNLEMLDFIENEIGHEYAIIKTTNGTEALQVLSNQNVQLVVSDVLMPQVGGFELCKQIKTNIDNSHIPVILLTAKNTLQAKIEGLESGADAYLEKPFSSEHLQVQIANLLQNRNKIKEYFSSSPLAHLKSMAYSKTDEKFLEKLDEAICKNITDHDLNVEYLAEIMNMSKPTLYRKIKVLSNLTPNELINLARLKKAAELLMEGEYRIYEVASLVGYNSQTSFGRNFLKQFGMTPSEYASQKDKV